MPPQRWLVLAVVLLTLPACRRGGGGPAAAPEEPPLDVSTIPLSYRDHNVILVSFDALQAAHVGALGYHRDTTPHLDAVARRSFRFTRCSSVASWTVPASMTWFTGVWPSEHRLTNKFAVYQPPAWKVAKLKELAPHLVTLAEVLKQDGYATAAFTGNAGVSGDFGFAQGFDVYDHEKEVFGGLDQSVPRAVAWLKANRARKFFLFLHGYDTHGQHTPGEGLDYRFVERGYDRRFTGREQEQEALREEGLQKGRLALRDEDVRFWRAVYDEKVQRADARFRGFLDELDRLGLSGKTLLVITSDHGTELYEHRRFDHGFTLYNELIHVPLFIRLPGQPAGKAVADRVSSVSVMPTILDLLGVPVPGRVKKQMRGASLVAAMKGEWAGGDVFAETDYREYTYKRAVIAPDGWKLIYTLESGTRELYNLNDDPGEARDLAAVEAKRADELQRRLFAHYRAIGHDLAGRQWKVGLNPVYPSQGHGAGKKE